LRCPGGNPTSMATSSGPLAAVARVVAGQRPTPQGLQAIHLPLYYYIGKYSQSATARSGAGSQPAAASQAALGCGYAVSWSRRFRLRSAHVTTSTKDCQRPPRTQK
jgi:hypothetical protein